MPDVEARRTLVKSPPELWSELSELERLAKHLDAFGEIRITRVEAEREVAWEGDAASGTVSIEPSGWGTKVTLTARLPEPEPPRPEPAPEREDRPEPDPVGEAEGRPEEERAVEPEPEPETVSGPQQSPPRRSWGRRLLDRLFPGWRAPAYQAEAPEPAPEAEDPPAPEAEPALDAEAPSDPDGPPDPEPPDAEPPPDADASAHPLDEHGAREALGAMLDKLGAAHHRPFSRA